MKKIYTIVASGIDSLDLAIDINWQDESFFEYLRTIKELGKQSNTELPVQFPFSEQLAMLKPFGSKGYEWILETESFTLRIGNWSTPKARPSVLASLRSLALWHIGAQELVLFIRSLLKASGAEVLSIKPSRIDLCVDIILPNSLWNVDLIPFRVTRAAYAAPHFNNSQLTGITIGKGHTSARLYDKSLEIQKKSHKFWMFDIWGIEQNIPEELKIIRIEVRFRRETIKELGLDCVEETFSHLEKLWAYFSQDWLKFQNNIGNHHTMRQTFDWWIAVQNGFMGVQAPTPLIRCKALNQRKRQLYAQTSGTLTSILALDDEQKNRPLNSTVNIDDLQRQLKQCYEAFGKSNAEMEAELYAKRAKIQKAKLKQHKVHQKRQETGLPSNIQPEACSYEHDE